MKTYLIALRYLLIMTVLTGIIYPLVISGLAQSFFPARANGSLLRDGQGKVVGSALIAQGFSGDRYFWPRPSAVNYNALASGGSNLGPTSEDLGRQVKAREGQGLKGDLLFTSGSGLDPHISIQSAFDQVKRVAGARGMSEGAIRDMVIRLIEKRQLGFLGEARVNVLKLNLALDKRM